MPRADPIEAYQCILQYRIHSRVDFVGSLENVKCLRTRVSTGLRDLGIGELMREAFEGCSRSMQNPTLGSSSVVLIHSVVARLVCRREYELIRERSKTLL
jgi:hypothetical protein